MSRPPPLTSARDDLIPPAGPAFAAALARNGYALNSDLDDAGYHVLVQAMENFQAEFLALTRPLWGRHFPVPGDALRHFTRQWEYPYAWANLEAVQGRVLDAGSGITFFPFLLAAAGFDVVCCDNDQGLGLASRFAQTNACTGWSVRFEACSVSELTDSDGAFDGIVCISVLEHVTTEREAILDTFARLLRPGGRLVITCDVDLRGDRGGMLIEDLGLLLRDLRRRFEFVFPLDLRRPASLLTSDGMLAIAPWRLPPTWRPPAGVSQASVVRNDQFRTIAVLGLTARKPLT